MRTWLHETMAEGRLSWLHLSDLRLPAQPGAEWRELEGLFVDSLRARPEGCEPVDLVLLSGGMAAAGTTECYAEVDVPTRTMWNAAVCFCTGTGPAAAAVFSRSRAE